MSVDGGTTDQVGDKVQLEVDATRDGVENPACRIGDLRADPVTAEDDDARLAGQR